MLDPEALAELIGAETQGLAVRQLEINYVRYKPATSCLAGFLFQTESGIVRGYAKAVRADALAKLQKEREQTCVPSSLGRRRITVPRLAVAISAAENDRKLRSLAFLKNQSGRLLKKLLPAYREFWSATLQPLNYKPARRFVGKLIAPTGSEAVLKIYSAGEYDKADYAAALLSPGHSVVSRLGNSSRHRILAFRWVTGTPLNELLTQAVPLSAVGAALRSFHKQQASGLCESTGRDAARVLFEVTRGVGDLLPALGPRARELAQRFARLLRKPAREPAILHGDFYAHQVLVRLDGEITFLDLDEAKRGDPRYDIGNFIAHLQRLIPAGALTASEAEAAGDSLLAGYRGAGGNYSLAECRPFIGAALLRLAHEPFRKRELDWPDRTNWMLDRAESFLSPARAVIRRRPLRSATIDGRMPFLSEALDHGKADHVLREVLASQGLREAELYDIKLTRHKPGRRCLIEYSLRQGERELSLLGKVRARAANEASYRIQSILWQGPFNEKTGDGIGVPEPMALIPSWHMWLQRKVSGESAERLLSRSDDISLAQRIAEAAHKLHTAGVPPARPAHTIAEEVRILHQGLALVTESRPALRWRLRRLLDAVNEFAATIPGSRPCGIHRDFYPDQLIADGDRLYLVDFDLYCEGDPAIDIGNFAAHLRELALRLKGNATALLHQERAFVNRYCKLAPADSDLRFRIEAFTLLTMVRHIQISTRVPNRAHLTETILQHCEGALLHRSALVLA